jgi:predicted AlkP superfamily pyrophosphatase or phosphodiesterase
MARPACSLLLLSALCLGLASCAGEEQTLSAEPSAPVLLLGIDGLEWSVLHPLLAEGRCPNMKALMERGSYGALGTFIPTWSPVIWTSVATGKTMKQHGITNFVDPQGREFTSSRRNGRALWNIADRYGLTSNVLGWWITWPVEPIEGVMVSATSASAMINDNWKPALMEGLPEQVHPPELEQRVLDVARAAGTKDNVMRAAVDHVFGTLPVEIMTEDDKGEVQETLWSIQSDETYRQVALDLLPDHPADLTMLYFGGPDVVGHRYWRQMRPEGFQYQGSSPEVDEALSEVIPDYYVWMDEILGQLMEVIDPDTVVILMSDHGMHEVALERPNNENNTGHHMDGAPGVIIAAGPGIAAQGSLDRFLRTGKPLPLGSVMDVAPTIMGLLGIPPARDMAGRTNKLLLTKPARQAISALGMVETHDDGFREATLVEVPADKESEFVERMKELGYMGAMGQTVEDSVPVNPETYVPDKDG